MADLVPETHALVGTWVDEEEEQAETRATYTVSVRDGRFEVTGTDEGDGEAFVVSDITWDGQWLRFQSVMPSTQWRVGHALRVASTDRIEHDVTFTEYWRRR
jgi:hypothetical protein